MREKFINYANMIKESITIDILDDLKDIFKENYMYHEEGACIEKKYHLSKEPDLFLEIGDIFLNKLRNKNVANAAYNKYLYHTMPEFYYKYANNLKAMGYDCIDTENDDEDTPDNIVFKCDKFDLIAYMIICLNINKDYDGIMILKQFLDENKQNVIDCINEINYENKSYLNEIKNTEIHLSNVLSQDKNRNDINEFAIELNPDNKQAYINIMEDYITYKHWDDLKSYYNDVYAQKFNGNTLTSAVDICWKISDFYRDKYEFYDAVNYQKIALELEVGKGE